MRKTIRKTLLLLLGVFGITTHAYSLNTWTLLNEAPEDALILCKGWPNGQMFTIELSGYLALGDQLSQDMSIMFDGKDVPASYVSCLAYLEDGRVLNETTQTHDGCNLLAKINRYYQLELSHWHD